MKPLVDNEILTHIREGMQAGLLPPAGRCASAHGFLQQWLCDPGTAINGVLAGVSGWLAWVLRAWWPLLVVAAVAALTVGALLAVVRFRTRRDAAVNACWLEITPPSRLPRDGALGLWRLLAGILHRAGRGMFNRRELAVEFAATDAGLRVGVWVPPGLSRGGVAHAVRKAWPGARVTETALPPWPRTRTGAVELVPWGGEWSPLIDPTPRAVSGRSRLVRIRCVGCSRNWPSAARVNGPGYR